MVDVVTLIGVQYLLTSDWTHDAENMEVGVQLGVSRYCISWLLENRSFI